MKKERFVAFYDAIMAIIMTIAVLEFKIPEGANWNDWGNLSCQILVYALSFFWLGMMWLNVHNLWHGVERISRNIIIVNIVTLFFASMIPFLVIYVGQYFNEIMPQLLYGIDVMLITIFNQLSFELLLRENPKLSTDINTFRHFTIIDLLIKLVGIIIGVTITPPAIIISVFVAMIALIGNSILIQKRNHPKTTH